MKIGRKVLIKKRVGREGISIIMKSSRVERGILQLIMPKTHHKNTFHHLNLLQEMRENIIIM